MLLRTDGGTNERLLRTVFGIAKCQPVQSHDNNLNKFCMSFQKPFSLALSERRFARARPSATSVGDRATGQQEEPLL